MYEVSSAAAYVPETWQPSYRNANHDPFADPVAPSPSASPVRSQVDRKPLLTSMASPAAPTPPRYRRKPVPQSPTQSDRYWDTTPTSSPPKAVQIRQPESDMEGYATEYTPSDRYARRVSDNPYGLSPVESPTAAVSGNYYPEIAPLRTNRHRYQDSLDSSASLGTALARFETQEQPVQHRDVSPMREDEDANGRYTTAPGGIGMQRPAQPLRRASSFEDIDPAFIGDGRDSFDPAHVDRYGHNNMPAVPLPGARGDGGGFIKAFGSRDKAGNYGQLPDSQQPRQPNEKAAWIEHDNIERKRRMRIIWIIMAVLVILAAIGGTVGGILGSRKSHSTSTTSPTGSSSDSTSDSGLTASSSQVKALLNNTNLHKVFPAMDYTGVNMQYPGCLTTPPIQDNVTLDMAMISQLTSSVRLYGTDCNQTEMVLTAIDRLNLNSSITVWLGVWIANNDTTNTRQLDQMYSVLKTYPSSHFKGVIVGNEVLFRKDLSLAQLGSILTDVRSNLTKMGIDLPVSTSDLGSNWDTELVQYSDLVMANNHPFFAGVTAEAAAGWTWDFWQNNDVVLTSSENQTFGSGSSAIPKNVISETGWPSQGGNDCGTDVTCSTTTGGSVAGIDEINTFMEGWVCQAMANGTEYFWFEAFDEPWKVIYDTVTDGWEDHWGLMDVNRNLKKGLKIPDCSGKTVS